MSGEKGAAELEYWRGRKDAEGVLGHDHYEFFFTEAFGLTRDDYTDKRVLDIGCGPRGSLEWASGAAERVGLDPLVDDYRDLGIDRHAMTYVAAPAERMPFPDGYFDVVSAFNALDHVDDVDATIAEMTRVARVGALGLILVEIDHEPTAAEPHSLDAGILDRFAGWKVVWRRQTGIDDAHDVYNSFRRGEPQRPGPSILGARLERAG